MRQLKALLCRMYLLRDLKIRHFDPPGQDCLSDFTYHVFVPPVAFDFQILQGGNDKTGGLPELCEESLQSRN